MRASLRRSCDACAKAKHGCDLQTPRCSRCIKRKVSCVYANEPLTSLKNFTQNLQVSENTISDQSLSIPIRDGKAVSMDPENSVTLVNPATASFDPFDSYPPTRLHRMQVQRLIHHFLSNIAFQYYPLDLNISSNPFIVSWWPRALSDPALFHVSLQTASLDEESRARKGFPISELLMADSVFLVRQRVGDSSLAFQDETINSVVTLAAIEHGKGNVDVSRMHIEGVKQMVSVRGGINKIKPTSPLTARMVSWVSMLVMEAPQFLTQDNSGVGSGLEPIPQWHIAPGELDGLFDTIGIDPTISDILARLRNILHEPGASGVTSTDLHDLTCYAVHKLLLLPSVGAYQSMQSIISECLRYGIVLYMLIIHGTTYYSHILFANTILYDLKTYLDSLTRSDSVPESIQIWVISVSLASTIRLKDHPWLMAHATAAKIAFGLQAWADVLCHLKFVLWMISDDGEALFRRKWEEIFRSVAAPLE